MGVECMRAFAGFACLALLAPQIAAATSTGSSRVEATATNVWAQTNFSDAATSSDGVPVVLDHDSIQTVGGQTDVAIRVRTLLRRCSPTSGQTSLIRRIARRMRLLTATRRRS